MPGPFPGMDPYLESPELWRGVHNLLIAAAVKQLNRTLPREYAASADERIYVMPAERSIYPDVAVSRRTRPFLVRERVDAPSAVVEPPDSPEIVSAFPMEVREGFIEIRAVQRERRLVTTIELLSHSNKQPGSEGRRLYQSKQEEILRSPANLLEVDLLRAGLYTVAAPAWSLAETGPWDYLACLHRAADPYHYEVWRTSIRERLPRLAIPLDDGTPDARLVLQDALDSAYEDGAYDRLVNYETEPTPPLREDDQAWVDALLRERGVRAKATG